MSDNIMAAYACSLHTFSSLIFLIIAGFCLLPFSFSLPFVVLHGLEASCNNTDISEFTENLRQYSGSQGHCMEIGNGAMDSWFMPIRKQIDVVCEQVKAIDALSDGYNLVGYSHGNIIARGLIEFCDGAPKVNNYVSVAGPHAGIASLPICTLGEVCKIPHDLVKHFGYYNDFVQKHISPAGYVRVPNDTESYLKGNQFLPYVNNEIIGKRNATYKERFTSLNKLALVMFKRDKVLVPKETSWFGFYSDEDGSMNSSSFQPRQTKQYKEDLIGLKTLDEAGKLKFISIPGGHLWLRSRLLLKYVVGYLKAP